MIKESNEEKYKNILTNNLKKYFNKNNIAYIIIFFVLVYLTTILMLKNYSISEYKMREQTFIKELQEKEKEAEELKKIIESANDLKFIEKMARENLKMVKPNETVYSVVK